MLKRFTSIAPFVCWLLAGGGFSGCKHDPVLVETTCDTTTAVSYANTIAPLMVNNSCNTCHATNSASAGVITDTHADLKVAADNGRLYGSLSHASGFAAMPPNGNQLSACDLAKVRKWIEAGAPNN